MGGTHRGDKLAGGDGNPACVLIALAGLTIREKRRDLLLLERKKNRVAEATNT